MKTTNTILTIIVLIIIAVGAYFLIWDTPNSATVSDDDQEMSTNTPATSTDESATSSDETADDEDINDGQTVIGTSVEGRDIQAYHFGSGETELLFVAGIHGGYQWNTSLLAYELIDYFEDNDETIPDGVAVSIIPTLNPDGLVEVAGTAGDFSASAVTATLEETIPARFNANGVDLNRNFACNWQSEGQWQTRQVDAGDAAFSEPESQALRDYISANRPTVAVVYYSAAGAVYSSSCNDGVLAESTELMNTYATASDYEAAGEFTAYPITGDAVNWMAKQGIPAISVLLSNHQDAEFEMNLEGIEETLERYAQ